MRRLDLNQYQREARKTAVYPVELGLIYSVLGLTGEAGELANKVKKTIRDGGIDPDELAAELGDVLWYVSAVADNLGFKLEHIAEANLNKLRTRAEKGTLRGSGDDR